MPISQPSSRRDGWVHEIKHDGYRTLLRIDRSDVRAFTRGGHDWSDKYRRVVEACQKLKCRSALIDGEVAHEFRMIAELEQNALIVLQSSLG